jgi:hypothetical protein
MLDDFRFCEERQKAVQLSRSGPHLSNDLIKKMSKSFAEAVLLKENERASGSFQLDRQHTTLHFPFILLIFCSYLNDLDCLTRLMALIRRSSSINMTHIVF